MTGRLSNQLSTALISNYAFFSALPEEARQRVKAALTEIGGEILQAQQSAAPVYTGRSRKDVTPGLLKASLTVGDAINYLRVRVGFPNLRGKRSKLFYAVYMEYGRQARTVPVRRLKQGARSEWRKRIREGRARSGIKPDDLLSNTRTMRVGAIEPRPFVHLEDRFYVQIERALDEIHDALLSEAGG